MLPLFSQLFRAELESFCKLITDPLFRRFFLMVLLGDQGPYAYSLTQSFLKIGALHLLVLSGSQIAALSTASLFLARLSGVVSPHLKLCLYASLGFAWLEASHWPPPLTRALLWGLSFLVFYRLALVPRIVLVFTVQGLFWDEHFLKLGFWLSWACWMLVSLSALIKRKPFIRALLLCTACQFLAEYMIFKRFLALDQATMSIVANLVLVTLFDILLIPLISVALVISFFNVILRPITSLSLFEVPLIANFLSWLMEGAAGLVLVVVKAFGYT